MYETLRIVGDIKPKVVLWENVKNVLGKKHIHNFDAYVAALKDFGYNSYYKVLCAADYGIPQNRERVYVVSIRKDIDNENFKFPEPFELKLRLKDMLDDEVDEKYYLSTKKINSIAHWKAYQKPFERVLGKNSICPTLTARGAGEEHSGMIIYCESLENNTNLQEYCLNIESNPPLRMRKITPKEAWKLMAFSEEDFKKVEGIMTDRLLYKQAGNSICVNVLMEIYKEIQKQIPDVFKTK